MNQSCFTLGFLSQNSLWKLSFFCGYKGYLYWGEKGMWNVRFFKTGVACGLWLGLVAWLSREIQPRDNRTASCSILSCIAPASMTLQLLACLACVLLLAACSRESPARSSRETLFFCTLLSIQHSISLTTLTTNPPKYRVINCWNTSKFGME